MTQIEPEPSKSCCAPSRSDGQLGSSAVSTKKANFTFESVMIPGGKAFLGTSTPFIRDEGESPLRKRPVKPFRISRTTVTNAEFEAFVLDTGYQTEAEQYGWSFVFWSDVPKTIPETKGVAGVEWWRRVDGANWRDINGPGTAAEAWCPDHPVVQVSWNDAKAYADWAGGRLPTELEWEHAARGGLGDVRFPWGDAEPNDQDTFPCNIWQGQFPNENLLHDGWKTTAPAQSFEPNAYGLYNMSGNVWEWTQDTFTVSSLKRTVKERLRSMPGFKVVKGGSFLCHKSYCYRYRIAARTGNSPDSTTTHTGFRLVWNA